MKRLPEFLKTSARISILAFSLSLTACGLEDITGSSNNSDNGSSATTVATSSDGFVESTFSGSVGDGPIVSATLKIYDRDGNLINTITSDNTARYSVRIRAKGNAYPLTIEVEGGTDLVTGREPDFRMTSFVSKPSLKTVNINPFSTMITGIASNMPGGITDENIATAAAIVVEKLNFGLDPTVIADSITTPVTDENVASFVKASEALGEMIRRVRDRLAAVGGIASGDDVIRAIVQDLGDGELDGLGGDMASPRVAVVAGIASAQVLIESMSNNLRVDDRVATDLLDSAIMDTHPSVSPSRLTASVPVNEEMLLQARESIRLATAVAATGTLDSILATLDAIAPGSQASEVEAVLPATTAAALDQPVAIAVAATDEQLNAAIAGNGVGSGAPVDPPAANRPPVLSGTPATTVSEDSTYLYKPSASDPDGDALSFSIRNKPSWATFNTSTGRLRGTPKNAQVGTYDNIVITVSDGSLNDSVGPFSIRVKNTNDAPVISGNPVTTATAGGFYSFQPSASDPDGDKLNFSIAGRPAWASFNQSTGRLSGTPANAGTFSGIIISVSDGNVSRSLQAFSITVQQGVPSNRAPVISGTPATSVAEDSNYDFRPAASDADGDSLIFSISNKPAWATFSATTGRLTGTPNNSQVGTYSNILITVSDGAASDSVGPFSIRVDNTNDRPVISGTPASSVSEDSAYDFRPNATDPDVGDTLTFSISSKPVWASFDSSTGRLWGTPRNAHVGSYNNIRISVSDGTDSASIGPFSITVNNTNDAPVISGTPTTTLDEGAAYSFRPVASDPDGDSLTFSIQNRPAWASFDAGTGLLTGTPASGDAGLYGNIRISVSDGTATTNLAPFSISVNSTAPQTGAVNLSWDAPSTRANGDPLALSEIAGYTIYYGESAGNYAYQVQIGDVATTSVTIRDLPLGSYYFVVTTVDTAGDESAYSTMVTAVVN